MTSLLIQKISISAGFKQCDLIVIPITPSQLAARKISPVFSQIAKNLSVKPKELLKLDGFTAEPFEVAFYRGLTRECSCSLLFVGWEKKFSGTVDHQEAYRKLGSIIFDYASKHTLCSIAISMEESGEPESQHSQGIVEGIELSRYSFQQYKSTKKPPSTSARKIYFVQKSKLATDLSKKVRAFVLGVNLARDLVNTPAEDCTPDFLAKTSRDIARNTDMKCKIFSSKELEKMGARALLAVGRASKNRPLMIKLSYQPKGAKKKGIAIVGKGITFDSGGLSIKSGSGMATMKCDMAGAATVLGAMRSIAILKPRVAVDAYIPVAENMIAGNAIRPGDVIAAMNKKTIEILNTDAEGRLILADALHLAESEGAKTIVDLATLTGACVVALGEDYAGLFSNSTGLSKRIMQSAEQAGERLWELPLAQAYRELINSPVADIKNTGGRVAGAITAALFLQEFVSKAEWAHIDIAGPAFSEKGKFYNQVGASGFGVRTIVNFILSS